MLTFVRRASVRVALVRRDASINDYPIDKANRRLRWPRN